MRTGCAKSVLPKQKISYTNDCQLHGTGSEPKGVPGYALVSPLICQSQVADGQGPLLADMELPTLCDLDSFLLRKGRV